MNKDGLFKKSYYDRCDECSKLQWSLIEIVDKLKSYGEEIDIVHTGKGRCAEFREEDNNTDFFKSQSQIHQ